MEDEITGVTMKGEGIARSFTSTANEGLKVIDRVVIDKGERVVWMKRVMDYLLCQSINT